jgi:hypothetical protein
MKAVVEAKAVEDIASHGWDIAETTSPTNLHCLS